MRWSSPKKLTHKREVFKQSIRSQKICFKKNSIRMICFTDWGNVYVAKYFTNNLAPEEWAMMILGFWASNSWYNL